MPQERKNIEDLKLSSSPSNVRKALRLRERKPDGSGITKIEELETLFADAKYEYDLAADDVRIRGSVIESTRYTAKGDRFEIEVINPNFKIMTSLSQRITTLAKMLARLDKPKSPGVVPGSA